jgi:hypothetical protein
LLEGRMIFRVVGLLRLLLCVEVIQVAVELVESVNSRQELIPIAQVVLTDLGGHVPQWLEQFGESRILGMKALRCSRQTDGRQAGPDRQLARDESGTPCRATGLGVGIGQTGTLAGNPIEIGRLGAHHALMVRPDVKPADVVTDDHLNVGSFGRHQRHSSHVRLSARAPPRRDTCRIRTNHSRAWPRSISGLSSPAHTHVMSRRSAGPHRHNRARACRVRAQTRSPEV